MTERQTVLNYLDAHASGRICVYNQDAYSKGLTHRLRGMANEGYCAGVCMEWLRRVLQGGKKSLIPIETKDSDTRRLALTVRTEVSTKAYLEIVERAKLGYTGGNYQKAYEAAGSFISDVHALIKKTPKDQYTLSKSILDSFKSATGKTMGADIQRPTLELLYEYMFKVEDSLLEKLQAHMAEERLPPAVLCWGDVHATLDEYHSDARNHHGGLPPTSRPFSGIGPLEDASGRESASNSPQQAILRAVQSDLFDVGKGMLFEVVTTGGGGHGHGVFREADSVYLHLDPNFGVWRCSLRQLLEQMMYLWLNGGDKGTGIYPDSGMVPAGMYRHSIWERVADAH